MSKRSNKLILTVVVVGVLAGVLFMLRDNVIKPNSSAGPQPGQSPIGGPMGGPMSGPSTNSEDSKQFQKLHQYSLQLMKLVKNIGRIDNEAQAALTPAQAKSVLAVLEPLRELKSLDESAAKDAIKALEGILTDKQRYAISTLPSDSQFKKNSQQMAPPAAGPMPSGPMPSGPPSGGRPGPMGDGFNPLNVPPGGPAGHGKAGDINKLFDDLKKKCENNN